MIRYKLIERERFGDAPFVGLLVSSISCSLDCEDCFNQHVKNTDTLEIEASDLINMIKSNPFEKGLILGGLEWSNQPNELIELTTIAKDNGLQVMIYTGLTEDEFYNAVEKNKIPKGVYIKFGRYMKSKNTTNNIQYGVRLASENQCIIIT